ncbi:MAG TPA: DMT family transporter [Clostridia bacterium]|nr:DMT family transporter [Clostridia bacterium]
MYKLIALITGVLISIMISMNGGLTQQYGVFPAAVIVHVVGVVFALLVCIIKKEKLFSRSGAAWWFYLGGVIGVLTTVFNNFAFGRISMTSIVALGLLGQTVTSILIDATGWFGMTRRPFRKSTLIGLVFCLAGIGIMLDHTIAEATVAVWFSLSAGISVVVSRSINARLAERVGALRGSFINHLVGLPVTILLVLLVSGSLAPPSTASGFRVWIYLGGVLGVAAVLIFNVIVPKVSQFHLTVLTFVGQVFTGVVLDLATKGIVVDASFIGGLVITGGIALNLAIEYIAFRRSNKRRNHSNQGSL